MKVAIVHAAIYMFAYMMGRHFHYDPNGPTITAVSLVSFCAVNAIYLKIRGKG